MLDISELNKMDGADLNSKLSELRRNLFEMNLQKVTTTVEKPHLMKELKKDIARVLTALNGKESNAL